MPYAGMPPTIQNWQKACWGKGRELIANHVQEVLVMKIMRGRKGNACRSEKEETMLRYTCEALAVAIVWLLFC